MHNLQVVRTDAGKWFNLRTRSSKPLALSCNKVSKPQSGPLENPGGKSRPSRN